MASYVKAADKTFLVDDAGLVYMWVPERRGLSGLGFFDPGGSSSGQFAAIGTTGSSWWKDLIAGSVQAIVPAVATKIAGGSAQQDPRAIQAAYEQGMFAGRSSGGGLLDASGKFLGMDPMMLLLIAGGIFVVMRTTK